MHDAADRSRRKRFQIKVVGNRVTLRRDLDAADIVEREDALRPAAPVVGDRIDTPAGNDEPVHVDMALRTLARFIDVGETDALAVALGLLENLEICAALGVQLRVGEMDADGRLRGPSRRAPARDSGEFLCHLVHRGADVAPKRSRDVAQGEQTEELVSGKLEPAQRITAFEDVGSGLAIVPPGEAGF